MDDALKVFPSTEAKHRLVVPPTPTRSPTRGRLASSETESPWSFGVNYYYGLCFYSKLLHCSKSSREEIKMMSGKRHIKGRGQGWWNHSSNSSKGNDGGCAMSTASDGCGF
ncbi:polygalacturonase [Corchorus olitorius]|uniref:Polygalacturonase n=1 Tax=Corchorus olitorius TaxID=93759 RepID=A0A1R3HHH9_9ROSI|nr:polygalacturonase [Corchorus olitorius]